MLEIGNENLENSNEEQKETTENKVIKKQEETLSENEKAVEEVENSVAEDAEKKAEEKQDIPQQDYTKLSLEDLVKELSQTIKNNPVQHIKSQVDGIRDAFSRKFSAMLAEKKKAFLEDGGNSIDFHFSSPIKTEYNQLMADYKKERNAFYSALEIQLKNNLEKRLKVIEDLKILIEQGDTSTLYKEFRKIQDTWRAIGPVPKTRYNDTWKTYHHHVERFYDLLHLSNDFRDLDFRNNLEEKLSVIAKAEALSNEKDINFAAKELQELHRVWKEDIGPVAKELREELWHKFSMATKKIHDKRHEYYKEMRSKFQEVIDEKMKIIEEINNYDTSGNTNHNQWQKSINEIEKLRKKYFAAGKLPYSKSEEVWQKFKNATKKFNAAKNSFYKNEKNSQQENLKKKIALIEIAESLKESEDWETATNTLKKVQADWKKIGHVPRKFSDDIWKRFKAACNHYFDRFHQQKNAVSNEQQIVVNAKKEFLESLKTVKKPTKDTVLEAINKWKDLGRLPRNARHLDGKFNKIVDKMLDNLSMDKDEVTMLKFTNVVDNYAADNDTRKLDSEQMFVRKKIDEIVREIQQLENNLGFFSNAKDDNPLVLNVKNKVEDFKNDLSIWKQKLNYIKKIDY